MLKRNRSQKYNRANLENPVLIANNNFLHDNLFLNSQKNKMVSKSFSDLDEIQHTLQTNYNQLSPRIINKQELRKNTTTTHNHHNTTTRTTNITNTLQICEEIRTSIYELDATSNLSYNDKVGKRSKSKSPHKSRKTFLNKSPKVRERYYQIPLVEALDPPKSPNFRLNNMEIFNDSGISRDASLTTNSISSNKSMKIQNLSNSNNNTNNNISNNNNNNSTNTFSIDYGVGGIDYSKPKKVRLKPGQIRSTTEMALLNLHRKKDELKELKLNQSAEQLFDHIDNIMKEDSNNSQKSTVPTHISRSLNSTPKISQESRIKSSYELKLPNNFYSPTSDASPKLPAVNSFRPKNYNHHHTNLNQSCHQSFIKKSQNYQQINELTSNTSKNLCNSHHNNNNSTTLNSSILNCMSNKNIETHLHQKISKNNPTTDSTKCADTSMLTNSCSSISNHHQKTVSSSYLPSAAFACSKGPQFHLKSKIKLGKHDSLNKRSRTYDNFDDLNQEDSEFVYGKLDTVSQQHTLGNKLDLTRKLRLA